MFVKEANPKLETIIGPGTEFEGNLQTSESIRVDGKIKGEIKAEYVVVGENGAVLGDITASRVTIAGKVKGNVAAAAMLELLPTGQVIGDIRSNKLIISDGATFEGNCQMLRSDGQVLELPAAEKKQPIKVAAH
ncbi:MAG: polymer-forming cytoskeletal protein [Elusimicrobia bacterium]|nr:polymer-forming cytoskeletal protein [Elusimicrobiota bacterium]